MLVVCKMTRCGYPAKKIGGKQTTNGKCEKNKATFLNKGQRKRSQEHAHVHVSVRFKFLGDHS